MHDACNKRSSSNKIFLYLVLEGVKISALKFTKEEKLVAGMWFSYTYVGMTIKSVNFSLQVLNDESYPGRDMVIVCTMKFY